MTAQRTNFGDLLAPGFREMFFERFDRNGTEYTQIVNMLTSGRSYEEDSSLSGLGAVPVKNEGQGIVYDDPIQGFDKRYTHDTYGMGFRVTREMYEDDLFGKMSKMPKALGTSMKYTMEVSAANLYNRAFSSSYTGGDGKELCATDHPLLGGGTEQNEPSTDVDLSATSLEQAFIDIAATTDDRGLILALVPRKLVYAPSNDWNVKRLLGSIQEPGSGQNDINPAKGILSPIMNHYFTDSDAWFILCDDHAVNMFIRRQPDFEKENDFDTEDAKFKATARWSTGFSDWRGFYGSKGA